MAYVHLNCLNEWRTNSANPKSYYECDQCGYEYVFGDKAKAFAVAKLLGKPGAAHALTVAALFFAIWIGGHAARPLAIELPRHALTRFDHWLKGSVVVAVVSLSLSPFFGVLRANNLILGDPLWRRRRFRDADSTIGTVVLAIIVLVGLCLALSAIYGALVGLSKRLARRAQHVVLDAPLHGGHNNTAARDNDERPLLVAELPPAFDRLPPLSDAEPPPAEPADDDDDDDDRAEPPTSDEPSCWACETSAFEHCCCGS